MTPVDFLLSVVASVIANCLARNHLKALSEKTDEIENFVLQRLKVSSLAGRVGPHIAKLIEIESEFDSTAIRAFLGSDDVARIVNAIYRANLSENSEKELSALRDQFLCLLTSQIQLPEFVIAGLGRELFEGLVQGTDALLVLAMEHGALPALHQSLAQRLKKVQDEFNKRISEADRKLDLIMRKDELDDEKIGQFEETYRKKGAHYFERIMLLNLDPPQTYPLDDIFVSPTFFEKIELMDDEGRSGIEDYVPYSSLNQFLAGIRRTVIPGHAGEGKSTFCRRLCRGLATRDHEVHVSSAHPLPIFLVLREYQAERQRGDLSFIKFVQQKTSAQFSIDVPKGTFEHFFSTGLASAIFDGLDEIVNPADRDEIRKRIENFADEYPPVAILVTSRRIGYEVAPLCENRFQTTYIGEFTDNQVATYAHKWFSVALKSEADEGAVMAEAFLRESQTVEDLRKNPFMLALMCFLFRTEGYIPKNRPDVYKQVSEMLFKAWDVRRQIRKVSGVDKLFRPITAHLAFDMYNDQELQGGIPEKKLTATITRYMFLKRFIDRDEADVQAMEFVDLYVHRGGILVPVGNTACGERLYDFSHRTFMEYFSSVYLTYSFAFFSL